MQGTDLLVLSGESCSSLALHAACCFWLWCCVLRCPLLRQIALQHPNHNEQCHHCHICTRDWLDTLRLSLQHFFQDSLIWCCGWLCTASLFNMWIHSLVKYQWAGAHWREAWTYAKLDSSLLIFSDSMYQSQQRLLPSSAGCSLTPVFTERRYNIGC